MSLQKVPFYIGKLCALCAINPAQPHWKVCMFHRNTESQNLAKKSNIALGGAKAPKQCKVLLAWQKTFRCLKSVSLAVNTFFLEIKSQSKKNEKILGKNCTVCI